MLLANITVAARITKAFPMFACLRRHPKPSRRQFDALLAAANSVGVKLDVSSSKALADSLDAAVLEDNPHFNKLLRILTTRCMTQAVYVPAPMCRLRGAPKHGRSPRPLTLPRLRDRLWPQVLWERRVRACGVPPLRARNPDLHPLHVTDPTVRRVCAAG